MKAHNLIASFAAVLLTFASLSALDYNVDTQPAAANKTPKADTVKVTNLAPVVVRPSAAEMRAAVLLADVGTNGITAVPAMGRMDNAGGTSQFSLLGSQLAMPYYSFGNKFGRISKE
ncbi:hypothetical protein ACFPME_13325 [Rhodanobacter umsongensis]|uniref:Uncharacterized protein n=1 Tax=Rhodanobacter umsongensis TaxID=633153 RepID=A0ABW0JQA6_9GAMM